MLNWARCRGNFPRLMLSAVLAVFCLAITGFSEAAANKDIVFTVAKYPVEARAANAVAAKKRALADGQRAAFRSLLKRIVPVAAYPQIARLKDTPIQTVLSGLRVRSERNSTTDYIATLDFTFDAKSVRELLQRSGVAFVDEQAPWLTLIPIYRDPTSAGAGRADRSKARMTRLWKRDWRSLDLANTLTPIKVQALKPVVHADTVSALANGDLSALSILEGEYNVGRVVAAIAELGPRGRRLNVMMIGRDAVGTFALKRSYRIQDDDVAYSSELAAVIGLGILEGRWKSLKMPGVVSHSPVSAGVGPSIQVNFSVGFRGRGDWWRIRKALTRLPGVENMTVGALSARGAEISLNYPGGAEQLALALAPLGLQLTQVGNGWQLLAN